MIELDREPVYETRIVPGFAGDDEAMKWRVVDIANKRIVAEGAVPIRRAGFCDGTSIAWQKAASAAEEAVKLDRISVKVRSGSGKAVKTNGDEALDNGRLAL